MWQVLKTEENYETKIQFGLFGFLNGDHKSSPLMTQKIDYHNLWQCMM